MMDLFEIRTKFGLNRLLLFLVLIAALLLGPREHLVQAADAKGGVRTQTIDELRQSMEGLIGKAFSESRFFYCCELIRVYVELFPSSEKSYLYLSDPVKARGRDAEGEVITLRGIKSKLLDRGRESLGKAKSADQRLTAFYLSQKGTGRVGDALERAMESEAKRLAGGDEVLAKGLIENHGATTALYLDAALFLSAHCLIFPNSSDSRSQLDDAAKCAEIADLHLLEVELRSRLMDQGKGNPAFLDARQLSEKAARQNRFFIAISAINRFLSENYSHSMAGYGYLASGDLHQLAECYDVAMSKYNQALLWSGDMEKASHSQGVKTDQFREDVAEIKKRANLSIGYALLSEAKGKHLKESTAVFAGKLHEEAVGHFERLVEEVEPGSLSSLDYLLGLIRATAGEAWYKRAHSTVLGSDEIQDAYARCLPACEIYLRVLNQAQAEGASLSAINVEARDEVAYALLEALLAMGKSDEGEALFFQYFIRPEGGAGSKWAVFAKVKTAKRLVDARDYLTAYPLLSEVVRGAQRFGLRDVGFTSALMMGVCISKLNPVARGVAMLDGSVRGGGAGVPQVSGVQMEREAYSNALAILNETPHPDPVHYPDEFQDLFLDNIRASLTEEYRGKMNLLRSGRSLVDFPGQETLLVDALSALDPARCPFNPDNLLVAAYLDARRELDKSSDLASKETTQNGAISHK